MIGNPPWLAFRHMSADLQKRFKELAKGERVYVGGKFATQNDLCALFTVRAAHLYLRSGGRLAFVLPMAALTRGQFEQLADRLVRSVQDRLGRSLDDGRSRSAAVPGAVLCGVRAEAATSQPLPDTVRAYSGPCRSAMRRRRSPTHG